SILSALANRQGNFISREELCKLIWNNDYKLPTKLSQLSTTVKRINTKLATKRITNVYIDTVWCQRTLLNVVFWPLENVGFRQSKM
ncbi:helix-turn-helix domain-containing protein, partial [Enterococcus sp. S181_ASV_20]|nr:helix-turn-helix domain-containing protein [Enterococcus sp. S181_ASV_20]